MNFLNAVSLACVALASTPVRAQSNTVNPNTTFANCQNIEREQQQTNVVLAKDKRLLEMENLTTDLRKLDDEMRLPRGVSPYPKAFLKTCFDKKFQFLNAHQENANESTRDSAAFAKVFATISMINAKRSTGKEQIQNYQDAYTLFGKVVAKDPTDWSAKVDRFNTYLDLFSIKGQYKEFQKIQASKLDEFLKTLQKLLDDVVNDKNVPNSAKIQIYTDRAMHTKTLMLKNNESIEDFKKILTLDPNNMFAINELALYYHNQNLFTESVKYFEKGLALRPDSKQIAELYFNALLNVKDYQKLQLKSAEVMARFPKSSLIRSRVARAQLELNLLPQAQANNSLALKLDPKDAVTRATQSLILERQADELIEKALLSNAIQTYEAAYQFDSHRTILRKKIALVIYRYRKEKDFLPAAPAKVEMKQIVDLLYASRKMPELHQDGLEILIEAASRSGQPPKVIGACEAYEENFSVITAPRLLRLCGEAYLTKNNHAKAVDMLEHALAAEKDPSEKHEIKLLINQLK